MASLSVACAGIDITPDTERTRANRDACGGDGCHSEVVEAQADSGIHAGRECVSCHEGTGEEHAADPKTAIATTDWTIESCSSCHKGEADTYLYDDNVRVGPYGGSVRIPPQPKAATFPEYKTIVAGHAFTRDYSEEGAHKYMLEDHTVTLRGKFETCLQCKSTKVAYAWKAGRTLRVDSDTKVTLSHTATAGVPAKVVSIPKGTALTFKTDPVSGQVDARTTLPDGKVYTSKPGPSEDATLSNNMVWASAVAAIKETMPYGAGCNHCHDPHTGEARLVRQAMLTSIEGDGGPKGTGGVNPYDAHPEKDIGKAQARDRRILACAQCHVEYVCGKSGIDKINRDVFSWAKARDLHEVYSKRFEYTQDWKNAIIGEPLIKSQHPEAELYWDSTHYDAGVSCDDCHMPQVEMDGRVFRSHWFTSPYKYRDAATWKKFASATGLDIGPAANPCVRCHSDRTSRALEQQRTFFAAQARVEKLLAQSVVALGKMKSDGKGGSAAFKEALEAHRKAHVLWENLAVSENSMGFHNYDEAMTSMREAEKLVRAALAKEGAAKK